MIDQISIFDLLEPCESRFTHECRSGSGFEGGRVRIYCASCNLGIKDLAVYLKDEYGVGGHSATFPDGTHGATDYNASGLTIRAWKSNETENWQGKVASFGSEQRAQDFCDWLQYLFGLTDQEPMKGIKEP